MIVTLACSRREAGFTVLLVNSPDPCAVRILSPFFAPPGAAAHIKHPDGNMHGAVEAVAALARSHGKGGV
jgi:hypothetical protein